jgi:hypothetical protein
MHINRPAMRVRLSTLTLALSVTAGGCGSSSPTEPSSSSGVTNWLVTQRFVSVSGPDNCWIREQRARWTPAVFPDLPMTIRRSGGAISLEGEFFAVNYAGTVRGSDFSAPGTRPLEGAVGRCQDGTSFEQMPGTSNLSGRFSGGDRQLAATEVNSYRLSSGEPVTYTWAWQATRSQ